MNCIMSWMFLNARLRSVMVSNDAVLAKPFLVPPPAMFCDDAKARVASER